MQPKPRPPRSGARSPAPPTAPTPPSRGAAGALASGHLLPRLATSQRAAFQLLGFQGGIGGSTPLSSLLFPRLSGLPPLFLLSTRRSYSRVKVVTCRRKSANQLGMIQDLVLQGGEIPTRSLSSRRPPPFQMQGVAGRRLRNPASPFKSSECRGKKGVS